MLEELDEKNLETFNLRQYWAIVRRRHWFFLIPLFLGWSLVWGASWLMPSIYRSGTLILVEQPTVPQQYVTPNVSDNLQDRLQSITQQILSRTRLLRIIQQLNLYSAESQRSNPDQLVERMRKDIEIELVRSPGDQLTSFNVYYSSRDPYVAQQVTRQLTDLFISENLEVRQQQSEQTTKFLESQLEEARKTLADQEEKVRQYKDKHLGELPTQLQSNLQILGGMQGQLQSEEDALNTAKQQNAYLQSLLGQYRTIQKTSKGPDGAPMGLAAIDQELERLNHQLADLRSRYTDRHPDVRKVQEQIAETQKTREQLVVNLKNSNGQADSTTRDPGEVRDPAVLQLQSQLQANQIEITNREKAIADMKSRINASQGHLSQEPVREQELTDLTRGYDQSRANYDDLLKKKNESELATSMELRQQGEHFRILDPPSLPMTPFSPNRLKLCGMGLFAGLVLGAVFTAGAELMDDRLYSEKDLKELIDADVISEIPNIITADEEKKRRKVVQIEWASAVLVFGLIAAGSAFSYFRG
jgi:succinoglycan biosynthesis transport protein ExoP